MSSIRDESREGDIVLVVDGEEQPAVSARATADALAQMDDQLGVGHDEVYRELTHALEKFQSNSLDKITLARLRETAAGSKRFVASYLYRDYHQISEGLVWYDVLSGVTGPDHVPAIVRNKLRYAVHAQLVSGNAAAEELIRFFQ